jgi:hypothetical protein
MLASTRSGGASSPLAMGCVGLVKARTSHMSYATVRTIGCLHKGDPVDRYVAYRLMTYELYPLIEKKKREMRKPGLVGITLVSALLTTAAFAQGEAARW